MQENSASRVFLIVAVVLGVLATVLAFVFLGGIAGTDRGPTAFVVVAVHDLQPNVSLDPERDLKVEEIPKKFASFIAKTLDANNRATYKGEKVNRRILAGQPVFLADLAAGGEIEWTSEGTVGLPIKADPGIAIPGDYVKVMSSSGQILGGGKAFRVLAVGGLTHMFRPVMKSDLAGTGSGTSRSVVLEVTEPQASDLIKGMGANQDKNTLIICPQPAGPASRPAN